MVPQEASGGETVRPGSRCGEAKAAGTIGGAYRHPPPPFQGTGSMVPRGGNPRTGREDEMSEKITEKLRKLLALSHSTNEHEAAQALAQAIRLAAKHGVDIEKLKGTEFSGSISEEDAMVKAGFKAWERQVFGWRPMLAFSEADIWAMVRDTGVPRHVCYEMGCNRLGCAGCIFSKDHELRIEMRENPAIFEALDRLEVESGYTMSMNGKRIRDRIK